MDHTSDDGTVTNLKDGCEIHWIVNPNQDGVLDMASERGESVAFTCAYAGNLRDLANLMQKLGEKGVSIALPAELLPLIGVDDAVFGDKDAKKALLDAYCEKCLHTIGGEQVTVCASEIAADLQRKADWLTGFVREQEWIEGRHGEGWFNSYYDNHGRQAEGYFPDHVRMMLTGQVFSIMGGVATEEQIKTITRTADKYLYDPKIGGYRLNTDFHELKMDMGRMFGFAYGEKENGAVFSHMAVMYANALYRRGFAEEGWKALKTLSDTALDFATSRMYPGIPEYFRGDGRGMYPHLTGAASWYMLTMVTEVFGVSGQYSDLKIQPRLLASPHFGRSHVHWLTGTASTVMVGCVEGILGLRPDFGGLRLAPSIPASWDGFEMEKRFRGRKLHIQVRNPWHVESGCRRLILNGRELPDNYLPEELLKEENEIVLTM